MVAAAFAACSRCVRRSRRTRMASSSAGSPGAVFNRRLVAGSNAVKTPAFDWRSGLDFQAHRLDALDLRRDRGGRFSGSASSSLRCERDEQTSDNRLCVGSRNGRLESGGVLSQRSTRADLA